MGEKKTELTIDEGIDYNQTTNLRTQEFQSASQLDPMFDLFGISQYWKLNIGFQENQEAIINFYH